MFKSNWEKTNALHQLPEGMVVKMVRTAYPEKVLISHHLITGGCANLNIQIQFEHEKQPLLLRIYLRDKDAAYREKQIALLLNPAVPVPKTYYVGEIENYRYAITEFIMGTPLRDFLAKNDHHNMGTLMYEVGAILSKIIRFEFSQAGFFDTNLNVKPLSSSDNYLDFAKDCVADNTVLLTLKSETISQISQIIDKCMCLLPDESQKHLVHGDFDPANILVIKKDGIWRVSGILDWEFAFSGSVLWDVANMLRYAHKMSPEYEDSFLAGLNSSGINLPENWRTTVKLLNLLSLLDCLKRSDLKHCPNQCADIRELIEQIVSKLM